MSRGHGVLPISGIPRARDMLPLAKAGSSFTLFVRIWTLLRNAGVIQIFVMLAEDKKAGPQKSGFRRVAVSSLYNQFIAARPYSDKIAIQPHFALPQARTLMPASPCSPRLGVFLLYAPTTRTCRSLRVSLD